MLCLHVLDGDVGPGAIGTVTTFRRASEKHVDAELLERASGSGTAHMAVGANLTAVQLEKDWGAVHGERRWPVVEIEG